jgi:alpha/beta superfamily hydrolase
MEKIEFNSGDLTLEGLYTGASSDRGVVVTHPHPLYGGDMVNPVVQTVADAYIQAGFSCLQFNFRGVGRSTGQFDNGRGEQGDVIAAVRWLADRGSVDISLAGYSFGSWVNAHIASDRAPVAHQLMVSPPVAFIDFADVKQIPTLRFVVTGSRDDIAPPGLVEPLLPGWNPDAEMDIIPDADHFYGGCCDRLKERVSVFLETPSK